MLCTDVLTSSKSTAARRKAIQANAATNKHGGRYGYFWNRATWPSHDSGCCFAGLESVEPMRGPMMMDRSQQILQRGYTQPSLEASVISPMAARKTDACKMLTSIQPTVRHASWTVRTFPHRAPPVECVLCQPCQKEESPTCHALIILAIIAHQIL